MATYTLIDSEVLASSQASVTFSSIPATYTDLVLRISARGGGTNTINLTFNGVTTSTYSVTRLTGNGSSAASAAGSSLTAISVRGTTNNNAYTSSTFSNAEIYIPSYTASQNKPVSSFGVNENNATSSFLSVDAGLSSNTAAITSITLTTGDTTFDTDSSFYLYGISNA
jgi:hypothetical protein